MSDIDPFDLNFVLVSVLTIVYWGFLHWIMRPQQQRWSTSQTIQYTCRGLLCYVILVIVPLGTLPLPPQSPLDRPELTVDVDAYDRIDLLYDQTRQAEFETRNYWQNVNNQHIIRMLCVLMSIIYTAERLAKRYVNDQVNV
ncbi:hypothetical protein Pan258_27740 [Symmachiella dynata]|uniref:hypothetical protein n=1 Tax=Symmachiella dynata TaxID=2527995 RepID=UPI00118BB2A8|nr:hypothetical protein [Symmachiella dynata]QDT48729.1 hypothetical protein Pan258_27740 [Symmachiella dynata]